MEDDAPFSPTLTESSEDNVPETVVIAPDGDAVLVVGPEKARLRVSTGSLGAASKVFKAMFSATWAEGQNLSPTFPKDIELPEDSSAAMEAICCVLHFRNDIVPSLSPQETLEIAIAADKYDLVLALRYATTGWLNRPQLRQKLPWMNGVGNQEMMLHDAYLLAAAYILQDVQSFARISHDLVYYYTGSYADLHRNEELQDALHPMTTYCLEYRRTQLRTEIQKFWDDRINEACIGHPNQPPQAVLKSQSEECAEVATCDWERKRMEKYKVLRERYRSWNGLLLNSTPISQLVWESEQLMVADITGLELEPRSPLRYPKDHGCFHRPYAATCTRCGKKHTFQSHFAIDYCQTFRAQWEKLKRRYCLCFDFLEGTLRDGCPFHHEDPEGDTLARAKEWELNSNPDGW